MPAMIRKPSVRADGECGADRPPHDAGSADETAINYLKRRQISLDDQKSGRDPMLDMFIFETNQLLDQLEEIMLQTDQSGALTEDDINEIFRIMHTIKGSSAMMAYNDISTLAHSVEDLFYFIREKHPTVLDIPATCDQVLAASDFIKLEVSKVDEGKQADGQAKEIEEKIKTFLAQLRERNGETAQEKAAPSSEAPGSAKQEGASGASAADTPAQEDLPGRKYTVTIFFEDGCQMENVRAYTVFRNLSELCGEVYTYPDDVLNASSDVILQSGFHLFFTSDADEKEIRAVFEEALFVKSYELAAVESYADQLEYYHIGRKETAPSAAPQQAQEAPQSALQSTAGQQTAKPERKAGDTRENAQKAATKSSLISVNINKLDSLMNLVSEIVISESMVTKNTDLEGLQLEHFGKAARQLRKLTDELQDIVMSIRMVPIAGTFQKMQRIVRDMSRKLGKDVEFVTVGEDTEVDKNIVDHLSDPLMHLIRNAMDHGVEDEQERRDAGKSPRARITLTAHNTGGDIKISVSDDGRGLDRERILKKAKAAGLLKKPESEMSESEIFSLILLPGFSTNETVTEYSGRGVGMDVVKQNIDEVGGSISIKSARGRGTTITIVIPLTLAIADAMELSVGDSIYTLPIASIRESFRPKGSEVFFDNMGNEMIMIRGNVYPIIRLYKLFGVKTQVTDLREGILIMVEGNNKAACLFVDRLIGEQQVVVKPIPAYLQQYAVKHKGIEGCTILGNGSISLILSAKGIIGRVI